jgi:hypothetical protein
MKPTIGSSTRTSYRGFDKWTAHNLDFNRYSELLERPVCLECGSEDLETTGLLRSCVAPMPATCVLDPAAV